MHDGRNNTYTLRKDCVKHTLLPLQEQEECNSSNYNVISVSGKEIIHDMKDGEIKFSLVLKPKSILTLTRLVGLPTKIRDILKEHMEIVVEYFPDELPPMWSVSHHMDLILGASIPNMVACKWTPKENEEIIK